ncbi:MAG: hypothetical protein K8F91_19745, partial [Candidatus Obscuribacterales bacterium]|nr:hypothetical protein [Candidatus Obscuribacterales bacterium]
MEITAIELKERLDNGDELVLLDIRQPHELQIACLENSIHIPLGEIPDRLREITALKEKDLVVFCRTGRRSLDARDFLSANGFTK